MEIEMKSVLDGIKGSVESIVSQQKTLSEQQKSMSAQQRQQQVQLDAIDLSLTPRIGSDFSSEDLLQKALDESDELKRVVSNGKGRAVIRLGDLNQIPMQRKLLTTVGMTGTPGVLQPQLVGGIVPIAQRRLFLRDLLYRGNKTTTNQVYFIKEATFVNAASPQAGEGSLKAETTATYTTVSLPVQTLSHWLGMSRQALDDAPALADFIKAKLLFGLRYREELQILAGDSTGNNLFGLIPQAAVFNTGLLTSSWTRLDILRRALEQVELADETPAGFFCLNPSDVANIELIKSTLGEYIVGSPGGTASALTLWGKPVISTTAMVAGTFLAGSSESAELIDRLDATVELSFEDRDNFVRNAVTLLCEERTVLCTYRPNAFVTGSLTSSPIS
ncbi:phage major capsid protein [Tunturiibacter gelidoferens]|uniref:HK97 family phage major capsid protein n=1 Tax=Tunturiibacter gelidiferens TaxID=3069689 RepID=A0A9X0QGH5_9BACT|nr:phage major capsid protein [Edaphobacter lichenicola]MBB5329987.1 HK97 family phage major capsid protein [Edaphobacter lichenicola]